MPMIACPFPHMTPHWDVPLPEELPTPKEWKDAGYPEGIPFDLQELKDTCKERNIPYDERRDEEMSLRERILQDMIRRYAGERDALMAALGAALTPLHSIGASYPRWVWESYERSRTASVPAWTSSCSYG